MALSEHTGYFGSSLDKLSVMYCYDVSLMAHYDILCLCEMHF